MHYLPDTLLLCLCHNAVTTPWCYGLLGSILEIFFLLVDASLEITLIVEPRVVFYPDVLIVYVVKAILGSRHTVSETLWSLQLYCECTTNAKRGRDGFDFKVKNDTFFDFKVARESLLCLQYISY